MLAAAGKPVARNPSAIMLAVFRLAPFFRPTIYLPDITSLPAVSSFPLLPNTLASIWLMPLPALPRICIRFSLQ